MQVNVTLIRMHGNFVGTMEWRIPESARPFVWVTYTDAKKPMVLVNLRVTQLEILWTL